MKIIIVCRGCIASFFSLFGVDVLDNFGYIYSVTCLFHVCFIFWTVLCVNLVCFLFSVFVLRSVHFCRL